MSERDLQRWHLIEIVNGGRITLKDASEKMDVSRPALRAGSQQAERIRQKIVGAGIKGLIHGNIGRPPWNKAADGLKAKVLNLSLDVYGDFNDVHFSESLSEREGITVSRETVRRWRRSSGIKPKNRRRPKKHRIRRERSGEAGLMMLWDGSPHRWFDRRLLTCGHICGILK